VNTLTAVAVVALLALPFQTHARRAAGVTLPDSIRVGGKTLALNGMGVHEVTVFGVDVYVAGLYLEKRTRQSSSILSPGGTKQLSLRFKRDVDRSDLLETIRDELRPTLRRQSASVRSDVNRILRTLRGVKDGDSMTITMKADGSVELRQNGGLRAQTKNEALAPDLLSNWVGSRPLSKDLKRRLLGRR